MQIYETLHPLPVQGCVIAIGNFDGVHLGHQALLATAREIAHQKGHSFGVLTFEPHPRTFLRPDDPPARLTPQPLKRYRLAQEGVEILYSLPFDWDFASQDSAWFIHEVLIKALGAVHVVVGEDFRFGQLRLGTPQDIAAHLPVTILDKVVDKGGAIISASTIRTLLRHGDMMGAANLLGWMWEIWGTITRGNRRGHTLGYPTANIALGTAVHPAYGVYAGQVLITGEKIWREAALNIGIRPMFALPQAQVEAHIFDFDGDIYDQFLRVRPLKRLRGEARFANIKALTNQMACDCADVRMFFPEKK